MATVFGRPGGSEVCDVGRNLLGGPFETEPVITQCRNGLIGVALDKIAYEGVWMPGLNAMWVKRRSRKIPEVHRDDGTGTAMNSGGENVPVVRVR